VIRTALRAAAWVAAIAVVAELADRIEEAHDRTQSLAARIRDLEAGAGRLIDAARADALCDLDRAKTEYALLAPAGTTEAQIADARVRQWRAMRPGFAALIDYPIGGSG
jgi:hypothetical protein